MQDHRFDDLVARARGVGGADDSHATDPATAAIERALMKPLSADRATAIVDRVVGPPAGVLSLQVTRKSRWARGLIVAPLLLAAAAAVPFFVRPPATPLNDELAVIDSELYEVAVLGARGETRGSEELPTFAASDRVRLRLRPRDVVAEPVTATVRATQDDRIVSLAWPVQATSARGHLTIEGDAADLFTVASGTWELEVTIRRGVDTPQWRGRSRVRIVVAMDSQ